MMEIINSDSASDSVSVAVNSKPRSSDIKPVIVEAFLGSTVINQTFIELY